MFVCELADHVAAPDDIPAIISVFVHPVEDAEEGVVVRDERMLQLHEAGILEAQVLRALGDAELRALLLGIDDVDLAAQVAKPVER